MFDTFKNKFERRAKKEDSNKEIDRYSLIYEFKLALSETIEKEISKIPAISKEIENTNIISINFSFNNKDVFDLLSERGGLLVEGEIIEAKEIESKIDELIHFFYSQLGVPCTALIIFEEEEAWQRALWTEEGDITFCNEPIKFKEAPEPSDVIWEYNNQSRYEFWRKAGIAMLVRLIVNLVQIYFNAY